MEIPAERTKLKQIKPNAHVRISLSIIYYMGTWPPRGIYRYFYIVYMIFNCTFILGIFLLTEIANFVLSWGNMAKMVAGATLLMTNSTHAYKIFVILYNQKRIQSLLDMIKSRTFSRDNVKFERILTHYTWRGIFHHIAYQSFGAIAVLCWGFRPIADLFAGRSRQLPMEGWYPYNTTVTPAFEITSAHQSIAIIVACFHNVAMDTLVTGLITVACCQLTLLSKNITTIEEDTGNKPSIRGLGNIEHEENDRLKVCVEQSKMIFHFSNEIQDIFGTAIFLQFLVNCIIICLIAFNITQMEVYIPSVLVGMVMYMCCMTYQIFIYCWHGNELHLHSGDIVLAAYSSTWWRASKRFKQAIQIIMTRAERPLVLSAGNILPLSLQTFVRILRMSYSIFTVLQSSTSV